MRQKQGNIGKKDASKKWKEEEIWKFRGEGKGEMLRWYKCCTGAMCNGWTQWESSSLGDTEDKPW